MIPPALCAEYETARKRSLEARDAARGDARHVGLAHTYGLAEGRRLELLRVVELLYGYAAEDKAEEAFEAFSARYAAEKQGVK